MIWHRKARLIGACVGAAVAFFLTAAQTGMLVGWCNTTSAIVSHSGVDFWIMPPQTPAFDYGAPMPSNRIQLVRSVPGVAWAEGMFMDWNYWQRPDGRRITIELVGLDDSCQGGPWDMSCGEPGVVHRPDTVIVDEVFRGVLGAEAPGAEVEILGSRAVVGGLSRGVRTFTAAPFVFTSVKSAIRYDRRYRDDEITYVLARCSPGENPALVRRAIARELPDAEVLTTDEFARRSMGYWMLETGIGITVVLTAVLGLLIGTIILSQTLITVTQDHLADYATLSALGFPRGRLIGTVLLQSLFLGGIGIVVGGALFLYAARASRTSQLPLEMTPLIFSGLVLVSLASCLLASFLSVRSVLRIDPVMVFKI